MESRLRTLNLLIPDLIEYYFVCLFFSRFIKSIDSDSFVKPILVCMASSNTMDISKSLTCIVNRNANNVICLWLMYHMETYNHVRMCIYTNVHAHT